MTRTFDDALARCRLAYEYGLAGGRTALGTPSEEASESLGLRDRMRARPPRPQTRPSGLPGQPWTLDATGLQP